MAIAFSSRFKSILIRLLFVVAIFILLTNFADNRENVNEGLVRQIENETYGSVRELNDQFIRTKDSLDLIKQWKVSRLSGWGRSMSTLFFGVQEINECDSCNSFDERKFAVEFKHKYFIRLNGYTLKNNAFFLIKKDKYYIQNWIVDTSYANYSIGHTEEKEVNVRYTTQRGGMDEAALLIPVDHKTYKVAQIVVWTLTIFFVIALVYILLGLPVKILHSIATGTPFTEKNIRRLNIVGWTLIATDILPPLFSICLELLLGKRIPAGIYFPFIQAISDNRVFLFAGLAVLIVAYAFKKGYDLQQEEDLTV